MGRRGDGEIRGAPGDGERVAEARPGRVLSLRGLWYRGPFEHSGSVLTLDDWFNPARTRDDYVPTGWKGPPGTKARAVTGHDFGLDLTAEERKALIAFLKTL